MEKNGDERKGSPAPVFDAAACLWLIELLWPKYLFQTPEVRSKSRSSERIRSCRRPDILALRDNSAWLLWYLRPHTIEIGIQQITVPFSYLDASGGARCDRSRTLSFQGMPIYRDDRSWRPQ